MVLRGDVHGRPDAGRPAGDDTGARWGRARVLEDGIGARHQQAQEVAPPVGRRQGPLPHVGHLQLGDGARHALGGRRPLRRHADARRPRRGGRTRLPPQDDGAGAGRPPVPGASAKVSWVSVFAAFLVAHMVGDYLLQTDWQARHKRGGLGRDPVARRALVSHVATYTLAFVPALIWIGDQVGAGWAVLTAALIAIPHLVLDD